MTHAVPARLDAHFGVDSTAAEYTQMHPVAAVSGDVCFSVYEDMASIEKDWRTFEQCADGTVFQSFDWLATWQRHIGVRNGVRPAIVVGRDAAGAILFLLPLSVSVTGFVRELVWLGAELCDFNAPVLTRDFSERFDRKRFLAMWQDITYSLQNHPRLRYDLKNLRNMPEMVGAQQNPMRHLGGTLNPSGAYLTHLNGDWEAFYVAKRSSASRRRDRNKRKRLSEFGEVKFVNPASDGEILSALDTLMAQKARSFARMGVSNLFAKPGYAEFYRALAVDPTARNLVHVSRFDVGTTAAAVNLGLIYRGCYYHLLASYDDGELSRFGPGTAHLLDLLHHAIDRGLRIFDFSIGDDRYKRSWCDTELKLYDFIAAATWRGALVVFPMLASIRLKRFIKQTPVLWSGVNALRAFAGSLRGIIRGRA